MTSPCPGMIRSKSNSSTFSISKSYTNTRTYAYTDSNTKSFRLYIIYNFWFKFR